MISRHIAAINMLGIVIGERVIKNARNVEEKRDKKKR
jgi:hypothetical protein